MDKKKLTKLRKLLPNFDFIPPSQNEHPGGIPGINEED